MTERTLTGNIRRRPGSRAGARGAAPATRAGFNALPWTALLLTFSVALAAAAVLTHKSL